MIEIHAQIHDKFSIEFKIGMHVDHKIEENRFVVNSWLFVPNSLDINSFTYSTSQFFTDVKSNIRLITPIYLLREIADGNAIPLRNLEKSLHDIAQNPSHENIREYEYQIKMFSVIFKSAVRDEIVHISNNQIEADAEYLINSYIEHVQSVVEKYRSLRRIINTPTITSKTMDYFHFGDEFISNVLEKYTYRLINYLDRQKNEKLNSFRSRVIDIMRNETDYRISAGYATTDRNDPLKNREFIFRQGVLKKYIESDLFMKTIRKKDGAMAEQVYYSAAAGLAMIFATIVAFSVQQKYGNFTMPLFVALVVSYMLKDRIKELMRYYFAHRLRAKYFDNKTMISIKETPVGWSKEGFDFITEGKVPSDVMEIRSRSPLVEAENRTMNEKIILYRKLVSIDNENIKKSSEYNIAGVNDIMRFHLSRFTNKMDNPEVPLKTLKPDGSISVVYAEKAYYMNIVMQLQAGDQFYYKRYRVVFNRSGISALEELK